MATLQIIKSSLDYFTFVLNDEVNKSIIDNAPNLTIFDNGALCHFKTKNGASLFRDQNISYSDITYTNASGTSFTFASVGELMQKLISEEFFKGLNQGTGSGASRFDELLDTFEYYGNDGKVPVVDVAQLKLIPVEFFNFDKFTQLNDVAISQLIADKILSVELVGGIPKVVLSDKPDTTQQLVNAMGWLDYNDLATQTTPLTLVANVNKKLTNDTLGAFTDKTQAPFGVNNIWNESTNQFNFQQLTIGDTLDIRVDLTVTTTSANQNVKVFLRLAVGSPSQYDLLVTNADFKTAGTHQIIDYTGLYIGSANSKDYPTEIYIVSDSSATCVVGGWYTRILRKSVNLVTFEITEDNTADHYRGLWNASTNTPTLINGFGQIGDWYTVSVAGGGYLVGDIVAYDGSVYYKKVNNNQILTQKTRITQYIASFVMSNVNTWRGWSRNTSNMLTADANGSFGTGATPTKVTTWFADCNVIFLKDLKRLTKLTFHNRLATANVNMQLYVLVADYSTSNGNETNGVEIINETFSLIVGSNLKDNFTIATHNLSPNSIMHVFYRQVSGSISALQGLQLIWEFEQ